MNDRPGFPDAIATRDTSKGILEAIGIKAKYTVRLSDTGPCVDITVDPKDFTAAQAALPFSIGRATVQVLKAVQPSRKRKSP
jgi:hypothetical protein